MIQLYTHTSISSKVKPDHQKFADPRKQIHLLRIFFPSTIQNLHFYYRKTGVKKKRERTKQRYMPLFDILQHTETA